MLRRHCRAQAPPSPTIAYPNNPTATLWAEADVQAVIDAVGAIGGLVVMDEAYQPFASRSYIRPHARRPGPQRPCAADAHAQSKFGLAGVRLGYMIGPQGFRRRDRQSAPALQHQRAQCECAMFALEHTEVFAAQAKDLRAERTRLIESAGHAARRQKISPARPT